MGLSPYLFEAGGLPVLIIAVFLLLWLDVAFLGVVVSSGQGNGEFRAHVDLGRNLDVPPVLFDYLVGNRQAQASPLLSLAGKEGREDFF